MSIGSRVHIAVSRNDLDCSLYVNSQPAAHSISTASIVYQNAFLVFGMDFRNRSNYFKGTMDRVAIFSQALTESEIFALYSSEVDAPSSLPIPNPTPFPTSTSSPTSSSTSIPTPAPSNSGSFQTATSGSSGNAGETSTETIIIATVCTIICTFAAVMAFFLKRYYCPRSQQEGVQDGPIDLSKII
jgi:hypothetical protein